ncbi:caffeoylshikimate esterase-like [Wolffia australiana]
MAARHPIAEADEKSPFGKLSAEEFYAKHGVSHETGTYTNPRGLNIFHQSWTPTGRDPVGIVCVVHGFTGESSWLVQLTAVFFAEHGGFAVCGVDHQGHGFSDGLRAHVPDIEPVVDDCVAVFDAFRRRFPAALPRFLYAESLGGAIALLIHLRTEPPGWAGAVLNGAMCAVSDKFKPAWPLEHLLWLAAKVAPTWPIVPTRGTIPDVSFRVEWKRRLAVASPRRPRQRPRPATALELLRVCRELQARFEEVTLPLLIVHGSEDRVCDPAGVEELHRRAASADKTLHLHPGLWHQLVGESDADVDLVFGEMLRWLLDRVNPPPMN